MKKFTAVSMALVLSLLILTGCGDDMTGNGSDSRSRTSDTQVSDTQLSGVQTSGTDYSDVFVADPRDWEPYDSLIAEIRSTADFVRREALMHQAEDMLMNTGAILPVYYENDIYLQKESVSNVYSNPFGCKFFLFAGTDGDTLRLNVGGEPESLDPAQITTVEGACHAVNSFAGLYTCDTDGRVIPDLAAYEQVSSDGMTYTITLLPDLKWSDGSVLDADDFVYAWNRAVSPETASGCADLFDIVARNEDGSLKVEADEEAHTLTVELTAPCAYFNELLTFPAFFPVKQSEVEARSDWQENPGAWAQEAGFITNGAYTLAAWIHGESMTYVKNPNYHKADEVETGTLQFLLSEDEAAIYAAYTAGSLDFIDTVPIEEIRDLRDSAEFHVTDRPGIFYACFNVNSVLFEGRTAAQASAMRRAFALLVDRGYLCEYIVRTGQKPANSIIPAGMTDGRGGLFRENDSDYTYPDEDHTGYFDPAWSQEGIDEAIALLEFAGYRFENGRLSAETPISLELLTDSDSDHLAIAQAFQQDFAEIGIHMAVKTVDGTAFLNRRREGGYDIICNAWIADFSDPVNMLEMWTADSADNVCRFGG